MPQTNFELPLPIVSLGGRGLATSLMLYYNSNVWGSYWSGNNQIYAFDPIQSWPSPGFSLGFGRITVYDYSYYDGIGFGYKYMLIDANGTRHNLGVGTEAGNNTLQTTDGSHITYAGNVLGGTLYSNDGTTMTFGRVNNRLLPTQITDTNGNYIQVAYKWETNFPPMAINYIVDTLGRVIQFHYDAYNSTNLTSISTPTGTVTLNYENVAMNHNFQNEILVENAPASFSAVSSVTIPQRPAYTFGYSGYGMVYNVSASTGGGTATVTYDYPLGGEELFSSPMFTQRTESPNAVYLYGLDGITRPDGTKLTLLGGSRELKSASNQTLAKTEFTYTSDPGGSAAVQSIVSTDETGQQTKIDFDYDQYGNVVNKREYGFKINGQWQVRRRTHSTYMNSQQYLDAYIRNRVMIVEVFDALQNTSDADDQVVARNVFGYDNYGGMGGMESYGTAAPPGHLASYDTSKTTRGNVTEVTSYSDVGFGVSSTHSSKMDVFGSVTKAQMPCCDEKSFTMTEATYWSRPSQTTRGNPAGIHLTTSTSYDFNSLAATSQTDPNNQTTTYSYDTQQNPTGFNSPTGANGQTGYNAFGEPISSAVTYNDGGVNKTISSSSVYDAWGQMTQSVDANGAQTNFTFDNLGRLLTRTNPFPQGGTPGPLTIYSYDLLGRITLVTLPGGNTIQTTYTSSSIVISTDQVNRKTRRELDGLGRLIKVTEQDVATGVLSQETTYSYDIADNLIEVNQGGQKRAFKYDSEGRLLFERIPEMTATINDGTGTMWTMKHTYTSFGKLATKTDARGVITTYGYDSLNRLVSISYNTSGAIGVATTPAINYTYDNNQSTNTKGLLLTVTSGSGYSESYSYDSFQRVQSITRMIDGRNYTTSHQLNTASQLTQMTYPSGRVINVGHDSKGRLISMGSYLTNVTYDAIGQLTGTSLGNGVSENYNYDPNRMQLTTYNATAPGGGLGGLMQLSYVYQASAGQSGTGTTAGNAGQLMSLFGTIAGIGEGASYGYDVVGRLTTSYTGTNNQSANRRYSYDRWGNRTGMWDATTGGNQIQNVALDQEGGAPTNRMVALSGGSAASYNTPGQGGSPTAISVNRTGRYIRVQLSGSNPLSLAELQVLNSNGTNLALGKTATQSSTAFGAAASRAVDGNTNGNWAGGSVTHTNYENQPWLEVDLGNVQQIQNVKIWNRTDCCSDRLTSFNVVVSDQPIQSYSYDASGNVNSDGVHNYQYDAENRLVNVDGGATGQYAYDLANQRYKKVAGGATTHYIWQSSQVIAEYDGNTGAVQVDYVYSGSRMIAKVASGATQYFLYDRLSTRLVLDGNGNVLGRQGHLPFGEDFGASGSQDKHHFTSYERDSETITDYAINRQCANGVGRFSRPDLVQADFHSPQDLNRYAYVNNDPMNSIDPLGLLRVRCSTSISGAIYRYEGKLLALYVSTSTSCAIVGDAALDKGEGGNGGAGPDYSGKVYRCTRPLGKAGSKIPCNGEFCHEYLCVDENGKKECWGQNPSSGSIPGLPGAVLSPGVNNPADVYHPENCKSVSSNACISSCVKQKFKEKLPIYGYGPQGTDCHEWVDDTLAACKTQCP
ncbi:MAG: discoidin domain-containing protein [Blastocatellia bacterium]